MIGGLLASPQRKLGFYVPANDAQWHPGNQAHPRAIAVLGQHELHNPFASQFCRVAPSAVVEARAAANTKRDLALNRAHRTHDAPTCVRVEHRHEIVDLRHAIRRLKTRGEDVRLPEIHLFAAAVLQDWLDRKAAPPFGVQQFGKHGWRVEIRKT